MTGPRPWMAGRPVVRSVFVLGIIVLVPDAPGLSAQDSPGPAPRAPADAERTLTLDEALRRAVEHNPGYRQARNDLELNVTERRTAWLDLLPQPSVTVLSTGMNWSRRTVEEDFFGNPVENPDPAETVHTSRANQGLSLRFHLDLERYLELRRTELQGEMREVAAEEWRSTLAADVTAAFLEAQEVGMGLELEERLLEAAELNREATERLFRLGREERTELLAARLEVAEQEARLERSRAEHRTALLRLRNLIGDPELGVFDVEPVEVEVFDPALLDEDALVEAALSRNPRMRREAARLGREEATRTGTWSDWLPSVSGFVGMNRQRFVRAGDAFFDPPVDLAWDRSFGFTISLPDPSDYFRNRTRRWETEVRIRNQEEAIRELRGGLEEEVRTGMVELRSGHRSVGLQESRVELAEERLELTLEAYRLGRRAFPELRAAADDAARARREALEARFDFHRARLDLERAIGAALEALPEAGEGD